MFDVTSSDGTTIRGWRNNAQGTPLILSNGLGTIPQAWPSLIARDSGYEVLSWYYRGTFASDRPTDRSRVHVENHVDDLVAVMDAAGVEKALVACWSIGVNIAFELAQRHPDRVAGLLAVAGVPGGTFATMGVPWRVPRRLRQPISTSIARTGRVIGPALTALAPRVPVNEKTTWLLTHTGVMTSKARPEVVVPMLSEFLVQDWSWYMHLAVGASRHAPMDLSWVQCPTTLIAASSDVLTSMQDILRAAEQIPHAQVSVLPGSHFLPMEYPELVLGALRELERRVGPF